MKILALEHEVPGVNQEDFREVAGEEALKVWELIQSEKIAEIYFRRQHDQAVIMLECRDLQEADEIIQTLPMVKNGLIIFELIPLKPYPGLSRLFTIKEEGND